MSCVSKDVTPGVFFSLRPNGSVPQRFEYQGRPADFPTLYFLSSFFAIGVISAYDAYLVKALRPVILDVERNPVCAMLIHWDPHRLSYFFLAKTAGTLIVLALLAAMYFWKRRLALPVTTGVTSFQVGLLFYLTLFDPVTS